MNQQMHSSVADFKVIDEKLIHIEGSLNKLGRTLDIVQAETISIKQAPRAIIDRVGKLEETVKYIQEDTEDYVREYDKRESTIESLDNNGKII